MTLSRSVVVAGGLSFLDGLKSRMHWHQARQTVLAQNVANADTPGYKSRDLKAPTATSGSFQSLVSQTDTNHLTLSGTNGFDPRNPKRFEITPSGNAVSLEDEMLKVAQNQSDYQLASSLYSKSLGLLKMAIGKSR
jgi:flagellar basal-body rod protein FlgB